MYQPTSTTKERVCNFYIAQVESEVISFQEIQKTFETGKIDEKIIALKSLIISLIHDEGFPSLLMHVINFVLPNQTESHGLKKILFFYWEIVEKLNAQGDIRDEVILVCNALRNDLLHSNEFIRGRTMKMLSRVPFRGLIDPLLHAILENMNHKTVFVKKNALNLLTVLWGLYGEDMLSDKEDKIEKLYFTDSDLSIKRASFILLYQINADRALKMISDSFDDFENSDIVQLAVIEMMK